MIFSNSYNFKTISFIMGSGDLKSVKIKGIILTTLSLIFLILIFISMLNVAFIDPGFLPNIVNLEFKLIQKLRNDEFIIDLEKQRNKANFLNQFSEILESDPTTYSEVIMLNKKIENVSSESIIITLPNFKVKNLL